MKQADNSLRVLMNLNKVQSLIARRFDSLSTHGISFSEYMILYLLQQAPAGRMRRVDLAERAGLTSSAVTRMLVPMEKIGLIQREASERDGRVSYAALTTAGQRVFAEATVTATHRAEEILPPALAQGEEAFAALLLALGGNIR